MKISTIDVSMALAQRYVAKAKAVKKRLESDKYALFGSKETAELKRVSMDLTRILADLRQGR